MDLCPNQSRRIESAELIWAEIITTRVSPYRSSSTTASPAGHTGIPFARRAELSRVIAIFEDRPRLRFAAEIGHAEAFLLVATKEGFTNLAVERLAAEAGDALAGAPDRVDGQPGYLLAAVMGDATPRGRRSPAAEAFAGESELGWAPAPLVADGSDTSGGGGGRLRRSLPNQFRAPELIWERGTGQRSLPNSFGAMSAMSTFRVSEIDLGRDPFSTTGSGCAQLIRAEIAPKETAACRRAVL